jgi:hypothetical protein
MVYWCWSERTLGAAVACSAVVKSSSEFVPDQLARGSRLQMQTKSYRSSKSTILHLPFDQRFSPARQKGGARKLDDGS